MTVSNPDNRINHTTTATDTYDYDFRIFMDSDLNVYLDGSLQDLNDDYTVTGVGEAEGTIVFSAPTTPGLSLVIARILPLTQETDYTEGDAFPAEAHEGALDRLVMLAQQFQERFGRMLKVPITSLLTNLEVPVVAGEFIKWNGAGTGLATATIDEFAGTIPAHATDHENAGSDEISILGLSGLAGDAQTPVAHALDSTTYHSALSANTDHNVSITKHGLCPILPNDVTLFLNGIGTFTAPASSQILHVREEQTDGTAGGTSTSTTHHTRVLNTEVTNTISGASLATNKITLPVGTYKIMASAPCFDGNGHKAYLYNVTDVLTQVVGTSELSSATTQTRSYVTGIFEVETSAKEFQLNHYIALGQGTNGLGVAVNCGATEIHSDVLIEKIG